MTVSIHFLNGNDPTIESHYSQKEYRDDVVVEIEGVFYEVYFFVQSALEYEMRKDGFFSFPGIIILDEITNQKIFNAVRELIRFKFFDNFIGQQKLPLNSRFIDSWYVNPMTHRLTDKISTYRLEV